MTAGRSADEVRLERLEKDVEKLEIALKDHNEKNEREMKALTRFQVWMMGVFAGATPVTIVLLKKLGIIS